MGEVTTAREMKPEYYEEVSSILFLQNRPGKGVILKEEDKLYEVEIYFKEEKILFFPRKKSKEVHYEVYKTGDSSFTYVSEKCALYFDNIDSVHKLLENVKKYSKVCENIDSDSVEFEVKINKKTYKFVFQFADDIFYINCNKVEELEFFDFFLSLCHSMNSYLVMESFLSTIDDEYFNFISKQFKSYTFKRAGIEWK